jgi:hypothetical protein
MTGSLDRDGRTSASGLRTALISIAIGLGWLTLGVLVVHRIPAPAGWATLSSAPGFWIAAIAYVAVHPLADIAIFERLWGRRPGMLAALTRRFICNELMLVYSGDAYLFAWARLRKIPDSLHAIKDVSVLSALAGNVFAVVLLVPLVALRGLPDLGMSMGQAGISSTLVIGPCLLMIGFRGRLLKVKRSELIFVTATHFVRAAAMLLLLVPLWLSVAPDLSVGTCFFLVALRQVVSRLPLVPAKDLVFAGAIAAVGGTGTHASSAALSAALGILAVESILAIGLASAMLLMAVKSWRSLVNNVGRRQPA